MGAEELRRLASAPADFKKWYLRQTLIANGIRAWFNRTFISQNLDQTSPAELPDSAEIVGETCQRILEGSKSSYIWDGSGSFDTFFVRCLRATCSSLRDSERRHVKGQAKIAKHSPILLAAEQDNIVAEKQYAPALAAAIAKTSMTGVGVYYAKKLSTYALEKWTHTEIADDLRVSENTVASLRARLRDSRAPARRAVMRVIAPSVVAMTSPQSIVLLIRVSSRCNEGRGSNHLPDPFLTPKIPEK
jgi:DNA-directed RNA polymerase specialized sigma24 family protein